ncbi:hypothetical protein FIU87_20970 [Bacillus sp. THAF10]|nr:hypothetical protein FIU87_20970 [Bacillus sp. THAF10]
MKAGTKLKNATKRRPILMPALNTAIAFRARLRFPRVTREPPRLRLRGLTLATSLSRSLRLALQSTAGVI